MRYMGSKNRFAKELVPIIQSYITNDTKGYLEPFLGGANIIDKIDCKLKVGSDIHKELIELLKYAKDNYDKLPDYITEEEYNNVKNNREKYEDWYVGFVGFCSSFGAKYFNGYARDSKNDNSCKWSKGAINNLKKQAPNLRDIIFINCSFLELPKENINGYVIYCDPPYRNTTKYKTETFPYEEFYEWCRHMSKNNIVLISEYWMPDDFTCIWQKESKANFDSNRKSNDDKNKRVEKLFIYNNK